MAPGSLDAVLSVFDRLPSTATIARQPNRNGRGDLWSVHVSAGDTMGMGQGGSLGDALRDLHVIGSRKAA